MKKLWLLISAASIFVFGCNSEVVPEPGIELVKYKKSSYNEYVSIRVKDSIVVAYPAVGRYDDSTSCSHLSNDYFFGECSFDPSQYGVLLNVLKNDWNDFLQNVWWSDTLFISETWKEYVKDYNAFAELWISKKSYYENDSININDIILNDLLDIYFERIY